MSTQERWIAAAGVLVGAILTVLAILAVASAVWTVSDLLAWSTYWLAMLTAYLVGAAVWAGFRIGAQNRLLREQIDLLGEQLEEATRGRRDALRPFVTVVRAETAIDAPTGTPKMIVRAHIQNVGPGPALNVVIRAWLFPTGSTRLALNEAKAMADEFADKIVDDDIPPHLVAEFNAAAAGEDARTVDLTGDGPAWGADMINNHGILLYTAAFGDIYGTRFPPEGEPLRWLATRPLVGG